MNLRSSLLSCSFFATLAFAATGCIGAEQSAAEQSAAEAPTYEEVLPMGLARLTPIDDMIEDHASRSQTAPSGAHLTYYGGPVLTNVNVIPVYWSSSVAYQTELNSFYSNVPRSEFYGMLNQYSGIGLGTRGTPYVSSQSSTTLTDSAIQTALKSMFAAGQIPMPNSNNYYPVHFPSGVSVTASDGTKSCVTWCAYHGTFVYNGVNVNYGVIPDQGGGCAGGCGTNSLRVNNLTSVSSHELVEATTDPGVGLATSYSSPLAWYDKTNGEIGDICNAQQATIFGTDGQQYVVQREFSSSENNCSWGTLADHSLNMDGTCYAPGTVLMQHEMMTLIFQGDGNLVLYKTTGGTPSAPWATGTNGKSAANVCLQADGNLVIYNSGGTALWSSKTSGSSATQLKLQTDCNLVLYTAQGSAKWGSGTNSCY